MSEIGYTNFTDVIISKRNGEELSEAVIRQFVEETNSNMISDYQIAAFLMAVTCRGMTDRETAALALAMADSGRKADLSEIPGIKVDKHSSGGVGDKCTLVSLPIVASLGVPVAKLSGRSLGFTGGTLDKLESITGFRTGLSRDSFVKQAQTIGMVVAGQTSDLAPADNRLYALRNLTGTIESIPLIASSIMSKKLASGCDKFVLNVTCGSGAFMKNMEDARKLADIMVQIGKQTNHEVYVIISSMNEPLGKAVGNSLEVVEAYETLSGKGSEAVLEISLEIAAAMLAMAGRGSLEDCLAMAQRTVLDGRALATFKRFVSAQGGRLDPRGRPILSEHVSTRRGVPAGKTGVIRSINTALVGKAAQILGAGRETKQDRIDPAAGIKVECRVGDSIEKGKPLAWMHTNRNDMIEPALEIMLEAFEIDSSAKPGSIKPLPLVLDRIGTITSE
ncbi:MAG: thymidine phosphorylase [Clostridiaceae bacterium]|nr:thymidine phosphorylase [Clostridiaceae bacterium]